MKVLAVADAFITAEYYEKAARKHPDFSFEEILHFGVPDREEMREVARRIERGGPEAVPAPAELYEKIAGYGALMVHLCPVTRKLIESAPGLKLIMVNRGGTENIDLAAATEHGIPVLSNPAHNANGVAEMTVGLMLAESRNIARADRVMKNGGWSEKYPNSGHEFELRGQTVGIIGFSSIGRRVARLLRAFGCEVLFCDPFVPADDAEAAALGCRKAEMDELMSVSDFVTLHARTDRVVVTAEHFAMMKPTAYFINTARPHMVDNAALYGVLRDRKIMGAALDVHPVEPTDPNDPMLRLDNVTLTNHRGGATVNSYADSPEMMLCEAEKLLGGYPAEARFFLNRKQLGM